MIQTHSTPDMQNAAYLILSRYAFLLRYLKHFKMQHEMRSNIIDQREKIRSLLQKLRMNMREGKLLPVTTRSMAL